MIMILLQTQSTYSYATGSCNNIILISITPTKHFLNLLWYANTFKKETPANTG